MIPPDHSPDEPALKPTPRPEGMRQPRKIQSAIIGCVLGTAVGDALGLPYEGLSPRRASRLLGEPDRYRLLLGRGMVSDDTEHTCMVAQALMASGDDPDAFARDLAWRLRFWLLGLPAGIGLATLKSILKLWIGFPPHRSGVWSAGNGPAMRSALLGAAVDDLERMKQLVRTSTRLAGLGIYAWMRGTGDARTFWLLGCGTVLGLIYVVRGDSLPAFLLNRERSGRWFNATGITEDGDPRNLPVKLYLPILLAILLAAAIAVAIFLWR